MHGQVYDAKLTEWQSLESGFRRIIAQEQLVCAAENLCYAGDFFLASR